MVLSRRSAGFLLAFGVWSWIIWPTFLRNIRPILGLGVGLVVISAFVVAAVSSWLVVVPLSFATALVLGAIVAPPDAVTAVAVGRKLGLPKRVMAILGSGPRRTALRA